MSCGCGCCEGVEPRTPEPADNPAGRTELRYRVGRYGTFLDTMLARLSAPDLPALAGLRTRDPDDPAIAFLDAAAVLLDVLTFYQERIGVEGYLRTCRERRSVLELARLVGYRLRPGVAASVHLAFTVDLSHRLTIPAGTQAQSIPGQDELSQTFETARDLDARAEWNALLPRLTRPLRITLDNVLAIERLRFRDTGVTLQANDPLLFVFGDGVGTQAMRRVESVARLPGPEIGTTLLEVTLQPVVPQVLPLLPVLGRAITELETHVEEGGRAALLPRLHVLRERLLLGLSETELLTNIIGIIRSTKGELKDALGRARDELQEPARAGPPPVRTALASIDNLATALLRQPALNPASAQRVPRALPALFGAGSDLVTRLLRQAAPRLDESVYRAWGRVTVAADAGPLQQVLLLRKRVGLFGWSAPRRPVFDPASGQVLSMEEWNVEEERIDEGVLFLDGAYAEVRQGGYTVLHYPGTGRVVGRIRSASEHPRAAYGLNGSTSEIHLDAARDWWQGTTQDMGVIRTTAVLVDSVPLELGELPVTEPVAGDTIELATLVDGLAVGRPVIVAGELADVPGARVAEVVRVAGLDHRIDPDLPGDTVHTWLAVAAAPRDDGGAGLAYRYRRDSVTIYANVVDATHGETRREPLGAGDGARPFQRFRLKAKPLTYVAEASAAGAASTLEVRVNGVRWRERESLVVLGPADRGFVTETDDEANTTVVFGDGRHGARLPSGLDNVRAIYRTGIGRGGNVAARQVALLLSRPLGLKDVINPLGASGGADADTRDQARRNIPIAVQALDRVVSVSDYGDVARAFAGIGKAASSRLSTPAGEVVHVTIAGAGDVPILTSSDLFAGLQGGLTDVGDPAVPIRLAVRELVFLVIAAGVGLELDYAWEEVEPRVRAALGDAFGFESRELGRPVAASEVVAAIQRVRGVAYVDLDTFGGIPEQVVDPGPPPASRLITQAEIAARIQALAGAPPARWVRADLARPEGGLLRPAQLAVLSPDVPDTLVLTLR